MGGRKILKPQEYHIGIGIYINLNKVIICVMCKNPKKGAKRLGGRGHNAIG